MRTLIVGLALGVLLRGSLTAQKPVPSIVGTWKADLKDEKRTDAPRIVIVRPDSSASYGTETVRWRMRAQGDSVALVLGGEWVTYGFKLKGDKLTLSGGDLDKPITLTKVGPPTARPDSVKIPDDPDKGS